MSASLCMTITPQTHRPKSTNLRCGTCSMPASQCLITCLIDLCLCAVGTLADEVALFWGLQFYNNELLQADEKQLGSVTTEILLKKDLDTFTLSSGWALARRIYFSGEECAMPLPDTFPMLPNSSSTKKPPHYLFLLLLYYWTLKTILTLLWQITCAHASYP